ncbi:Hypothetical predicted protein [Scomber scombrus]|uniref:Uncharacterized protein n=1 Tax=Scomber scombrus TaxID=13677 RepID=A0AAV1PVE3_SCOSC
MSRCGYFVNRRLDEVGPMKQSKDLKRETESERAKGQRDQRGRKCLNGTTLGRNWTEKKERRERRGPVETKDVFKKSEEDEIDADLQIMMEKLRGHLFARSPLPDSTPPSLSLFDSA